MMEGPGGASIAELRIRDGKRESVFGSYVRPLMSQSNLTVLTNALVSRLILDGKRVTGVEVVIDGQVRRFTAGCETVLSLGAINTPKVLMQSGIGPEDELKAHGIPVVQHLPGVGRNHQDHLAFGCTWSYREPQAVGGTGCEAKLYWRSSSKLTQPDILQCQLEFAVPSPVETGLETPEHGWTMFNGLAQPKSRGRLRLSGADVSDAMLINRIPSASPKTWLPPWSQSSCAGSLETATRSPP
jgi:choline dehydrogenase